VLFAVAFTFVPHVTTQPSDSRTVPPPSFDGVDLPFPAKDLSQPPPRLYSDSDIFFCDCSPPWISLFPSNTSVRFDFSIPSTLRTRAPAMKYVLFPWRRPFPSRQWPSTLDLTLSVCFWYDPSLISPSDVPLSASATSYPFSQKPDLVHLSGNIQPVVHLPVPSFIAPPATTSDQHFKFFRVAVLPPSTFHPPRSYCPAQRLPLASCRRIVIPARRCKPPSPGALREAELPRI